MNYPIQKLLRLVRKNSRKLDAYENRTHNQSMVYIRIGLVT